MKNFRIRSERQGDLFGLGDDKDQVPTDAEGRHILGASLTRLSTPMCKFAPGFDSIALAGILGPGGTRCVVRNPSIPLS